MTDRSKHSTSISLMSWCVTFFRRLGSLRLFCFANPIRQAQPPGNFPDITCWRHSPVRVHHSSLCLLHPTMTVPCYCGRPCRSYLLSLIIALGLICGAISIDADNSDRSLRLTGDGANHATEHHHEEGHANDEHNANEDAVDLGMTWIEPENLPAEIQFERKLNMMGCGKYRL